MSAFPEIAAETLIWAVAIGPIMAVWTLGFVLDLIADDRAPADGVAR